MMALRRWGFRAALAAVLGAAPLALAQAVPTATQQFGLSAFGGGTGVYTDIFGGHNLSLTAGGDLTLRSFFGVNPSLELRGTYPIHSGTIAGEKEILAGLKVEKRYWRIHPYGNVLVGRGQMNFQNGGFPSGRFIYNYSSSTIYSLGGGGDLDLTSHWGLKADYQYQLWTTYPLELKILKPKLITAGILYRFDFNNPRRSHKRRQSAPEPRPPAPLPGQPNEAPPQGPPPLQSRP